MGSGLACDQSCHDIFTSGILPLKLKSSERSFNSKRWEEKTLDAARLYMILRSQRISIATLHTTLLLARTYIKKSELTFFEVMVVAYRGFPSQPTLCFEMVCSMHLFMSIDVFPSSWAFSALFWPLAGDIYIHPDYNDETKDNHMALVFLEVAVGILSNDIFVDIEPVKLNRYSEVSKDMLEVFGWGATNSISVASKLPRTLSVGYISECSDPEFETKPSMMCARSTEPGMYGPCTFDEVSEHMS